MFFLTHSVYNLGLVMGQHVDILPSRNISATPILSRVCGIAGQTATRCCSC